MGAQYEPGEMSFVPLVAVVFTVVLAVVFELVVVFVVVFAVVVVAVPALFDELACVVVGATVERAVVDEATVVVVVVVAGELEKPGAALQLAIVKVEHSLVNKFLIRPNSLWSIDRPHRAFTEIQSPKYVHQ
jgi:hypothetical protein